ncbi:MAG: peptide deformylase [Candidatus Wildermuthbacteria bacterium]|nr:peptide deformylase [Candidatus Wildermuthbacteria bacterium]
MATLSIVIYPAKILRQEAVEVSPITSEIKRLIPQMIETMYGSQGIGLAAPQVGISKKLIIVETSDDPRATVRETTRHIRGKPALPNRGRPLAFLNPVIVKKSKETAIDEEGCLSLPGIFVPVKRAESIEILCQTADGSKVRVEAGGLTARIFQHEIDHLNGKLIINHLDPLKKLKVRRQLKELVHKTR